MGANGIPCCLLLPLARRFRQTTVVYGRIRSKMYRHYLILLFALRCDICFAQSSAPRPPNLVAVPPGSVQTAPMPYNLSPAVRRGGATRLIFSMTYLMKKNCENLTPSVSKKLNQALTRFRTTYPDVMLLEDRSPYLPVSAEDFEAFLSDTNSESKHTKFASAPNSLEIRACMSQVSGLDNLVYLAQQPSGMYFRRYLTAALSP